MKRTMKRLRKKVLIILPAGIIFLCILFCLIWQYRLRGSSKLIPMTDFESAEPVFYRQNDEKWAQDTLGESAFTMESSGCLVTCIASAMEMSAKSNENESSLYENKDPGDLNAWFSQNRVYDTQGNLQWGELNKLNEFQVEVYETFSAGLLMECLEQGRYPVVRVRMGGIGNFHYVLIVKAEDGMFYCMDPLREEETLVPLSEYNCRVYAVRCVYSREQ